MERKTTSSTRNGRGHRLLPVRSADSAIRCRPGFGIPLQDAGLRTVSYSSQSVGKRPSSWHSFQRLLITFQIASGNRNRETGALTVVGTNGYAWSSSPYAAGNANGGFLNFNSGNVNPLNNTNRANAFPVRCVQHLPEVVFGDPCFLEKSGSPTRNDKSYGLLSVWSVDSAIRCRPR